MAEVAAQWGRRWNRREEVACGRVHNGHALSKGGTCPSMCRACEELWRERAWAGSSRASMTMWAGGLKREMDTLRRGLERVLGCSDTTWAGAGFVATTCKPESWWRQHVATAVLGCVA